MQVSSAPAASASLPVAAERALPAELPAATATEPIGSVTPTAFEQPVPGAAMSCGGKSCDLERSFCCGVPGQCLARPTRSTRLTKDGYDFFEAGYISTPERTSMGYTKYFAALRAICTDHTAAGSLTDVRLCDDFADCPRGWFCCHDRDDFGADSWAQCRQLRGASIVKTCGGRGAFEVCSPGSKCVSPGTMCIGGKCRRPTRTVKCDRQTCTGANLCCAPFGYGQVPYCALACPDDSLDFDCDEPADCPVGMMCCASISSSYGAPGAGRCKGSCAWGDEAIVCGAFPCSDNEKCAPCRAR